ncbi:MAG: lipid-A-disaccharide synthase [Rickettsiales bacterium]|nr:MAG: lipid-A-disaccharide synthase [Rickettsiales bacterium]
MKFYIIAGETSGDYIGGLLIDAIKAERRGSASDGAEDEFFGIGGNNMRKAGLDSLFPIDQINIMGFFEILPQILRIKKLIDLAARDIIRKNPQILVTIDAPGFTFRVAKKVRELAPEIKLVHIVAPSVWAYKPGRAAKYAKLYDHLLTLLPFEPQYFTKLGLESTCIGHPILEQTFFKKSPALKAEMGCDKDAKLIAITPGSRKGEIARHMPVIRQACDLLACTHKIKAIFVQPDDSNIHQISSFLSGAKFDYSFSTDRLKAFAASDCALAKSGTNSLEIAASKTPMIVGYKMHPMSFFLLKMMIKVKYASLINIIPNREIIPEYIQSEFNKDNIIFALSQLINDKKRAQDQVKGAEKILESIGFSNGEKPSEIAAKIIIKMIS